MNDPLAEQVIDHILRSEWNLLLDAGRAWNQTEKNNAIPQLIIITGLLFKGKYREAHDHHEALFSKSDDIESQNDPRSRLKDFAERLARKHDGNAGAHLFFGVTLVQIGELEAAIREFKETIRLAPEDAYAHYFQGQAHEAMDRLDIAIRNYRDAVRFAPENVTMRLNLGSA